MLKGVMTPRAYLDYNATSPLLPEAAAAITSALGDFGNPSSVHGFGRKARASVETAREAVAALCDAQAQDVIFTSGGTEANALALSGLAKGMNCTAVLASSAEHMSVLAHVAEENLIPVNPQGVIDLNALEQRLKAAKPPVLVALMLANNETGAVQPVAQAFELARKYGALLHCDAVQAAGKIKIDFDGLGVDTLSLSAHKHGGPKGIGALIVRRGLTLHSQMPGGGQERRRRAGTENVLGIAGYGAAAAAVSKLLDAAPRIRALRDQLEAVVKRECPTAQIYSAQVERLGNTSCVGLPGVSAETQLMRLDLAGVAVSSGSACSSGKIAPSHVLTAMDVGAAEAKCAIRVSLGWNTTESEITQFIEAWRPLAAQAAA